MSRYLDAFVKSHYMSIDVQYKAMSKSALCWCKRYVDVNKSQPARLGPRQGVMHS
jgi:hypothetical protein